MNFDENKESETGSSKFYLNLLKEIKTKKVDPSSICLKLHQPSLSLESILQNMEQVNDTICEMMVISKIPVSQHLEYFLSKSKSFDDPKYERLFDISTKGAGCKEAKIGSKLLDYSVRDKLVGFCSKSGKPQWNDEKISAFFDSIKESNQIM